MTFILPADPSDGQVAPASWGDDVRNALSFLANPPACRVSKAAAQSIPTGAWTSISFDTERFDTAAMHSTVTNPTRITIPTAGVYVVHGAAEFGPNATGLRGLRVWVNNSFDPAMIYFPAWSGGSGIGVDISTVYKFAVGDFLELQAYQSSGVALNVNKLTALPEFAACWVGLG